MATSPSAHIDDIFTAMRANGGAFVDAIISGGALVADGGAHRIMLRDGQGNLLPPDDTLLRGTNREVAAVVYSAAATHALETIAWLNTVVGSDDPTAWDYHYTRLDYFRAIRS